MKSGFSSQIGSNKGRIERHVFDPHRLPAFPNSTRQSYPRLEGLMLDLFDKLIDGKRRDSPVIDAP
jgi:hypothetical protein